MKKKRLKKIVFILLGIIGLIIVSIPLIVWLAFGPIHTTGEILISENNVIEYKEIYNGDFAGEFYAVTFFKSGSAIGSHTFHNMHWDKDILVDSILNRTFLFIADSCLDKSSLYGYYLISFESNFQNVIDTVYSEIECFNYQEKMREIIDKVE